jgi:hypothetical protein
VSSEPQKPPGKKDSGCSEASTQKRPARKVAATKEQRHPDESAMNGAVAQKKKERRRKACLQ